MPSKQGESQKSSIRTLALAALGIVFGDIGTSPLYTLQQCFHVAELPVSPANVVGILSLLFWSLIIVVTLKYVLFVMRADNSGEGGIMALLALTSRLANLSASTRRRAVTIGLIGAALFYGDGIITPAISVLSAVEGLEIATPLLKPYVVPVTMTVLIALFSIQGHGTALVGRYFGPLMALWFAVLALLGAHAILEAPRVLAAISPLPAIGFVASHGFAGFASLGAIVLAVTGAEALYADMGHFGAAAIRTAWFYLTLPALLLSYFGQGAHLLINADTIRNPFFLLAPDWATVPLVLLATAATVVASQAVISGTYSMTREAFLLGFLPRTEVRQTSESERGQIYLPAVNWLLMLGVLGLVAFFKSSGNLAAAYGIAVSGTMLTTTLLMYLVARQRWQWPRWRARAVIGLLLIVDVGFFGANTLKIVDGGWLPVAVGVAIYSLMAIWRAGRAQIFRILHPAPLPIETFVRSQDSACPLRVPGTAIFLAAAGDEVPHALLHNLKHNKVLHERVVVFSVQIENIPKIRNADRYTLRSFAHGIHHLVAHVGFAELPNIPRLLNGCTALTPLVDVMETSFFLSRLRVIRGEQPTMSLLGHKIFAALLRNSAHATDFYRLPYGRVVELDLVVTL